MWLVTGVQATNYSIKAFYPENFLFTFYSQATRDWALAVGSLPIWGTSLMLHQWTHLAHAEASTLFFKVAVELQGVPPHQWNMATARQVLGSSC